MIGSARLFLPLSLLVGMLLCCGTAHGQYYYNGYGGGYHASTAGESYARGMADAVRSQGMKNLADSRAAINVEEARSKYIDNRTQATNAYWERKRIYEENTAQEKYERDQKLAARRSRNTLQRLTPEQFDPTTGQISWPMILKEAQYDEYRKPLTEIFLRRGQSGALVSADYLQAKQLIKDFRAAVTANKATYPKEALSQSLRFLLNLNRELDMDLS